MRLKTLSCNALSTLIRVPTYESFVFALGFQPDYTRCSVWGSCPNIVRAGVYSVMKRSKHGFWECWWEGRRTGTEREAVAGTKNSLVFFLREFLSGAARTPATPRPFNTPFLVLKRRCRYSVPRAQEGTERGTLKPRCLIFVRLISYMPPPYACDAVLVPKVRDNGQ